MPHALSPASRRSTDAPPQELPEVPAGNLCPFLRGLVAAGRLDDHQASLATLAQVVSRASAGLGEAPLPLLAIGAIALVGNGLSPLRD